MRVSRVSTLMMFAAVLASANAWAVPAFARQTGMSCSQCHTVFPELTPFGRLFKMNGYVLQNVRPLEDINIKKESTLSIGDLPPISAMFIASSTWTSKGQPDSANNAKAQNGTVGFPQQASLFYAGRIADNFGAFFQLTYNPTFNSIGIDNPDLRFADHGGLWNQDLIYGVTVNNNPTVQDVWNTVPSWTFPFTGPLGVPTPAAQGRLLTSLIAQQTAGAGPYVYINKSVYLEASAYHSAKIGATNSQLSFPLDSATTNVIDGAAPYWRFAYNREWGKNSLMIGHWGMYASLAPGNGAPVVASTNNKFTDFAFDSQYQWIGEDHILSLTGTILYERQKLDASRAGGTATNPFDHLLRESIVAAYYYQRRYGLSLGWFNINGTTDPLQYPTSPGNAQQNLTGSANGSPDSRWVTAEADYLPWLNTKLYLQYVAYQKFNGGSGQYNFRSSDRRASDNNTLLAGLWFSF